MTGIFDRLAGALFRLYDLLGVTGRVGVLLVIIAWLVVSFSAQSNRRAVIEWLGACGLYLALVSLFTNLSLLARESGSTVALVGFGFLLALFGSGLIVSLVQTALAIRSPGGSTSVSATH
jgi:hypothetical protein